MADLCTLLVSEFERSHEESSQSFSAPGTPILAARIAAQTGGNPASTHARAENLARLRVVVCE